MSDISVLIIDDNEPDRYILKRHLKDTKLVTKVFEETDGKFALDFLLDYDNNLKKYPNHFPPSLLFLDINMPLVGGFELLEKLNELKDDRLSSIVIMMFSSSSRQADIDKSFSYEFVKDYLIKGDIDSDLLKEKIQNLFPS